MEIVITRQPTNVASPGTLTINNIFECFTLEDFDRGLVQTMTLSEIVNRKVHGQTAIPKGRYEMVISFSERFNRLLPLLQNVPGFIGIRIHPGNGTGDTEGCILVGTQLAGNTIVGGTSRPAFNALFTKIQATLRREKIFVTVQ